MQLLQGTPRGLVWIESVRVLEIPHRERGRAQCSHLSEGERTRLELQRIGWPLRQAARQRHAAADRDASAYITDHLSPAETQAILATQDHPARQDWEEDCSDPLLVALVRVLPLVASNMCRFVVM